MPATITGRIYTDLNNNGQYKSNNSEQSILQEPQSHLCSINAADLIATKTDTKDKDITNHKTPITTMVTKAADLEVMVSSILPDPNLDQNTTAITALSTETADLAFTMQADKNTVRIGDTLTYTITVTNLGTIDAENVSVRDNIPAALTAVQYSIDHGASWLPWISPYSFGRVENGSARSLFLRGIVTASSSIHNTASISSTTPDPDYTNNAAYSSVHSNQDVTANLSITKAVLTHPVIPNTFIIYQLTIQNSGPDTAENVLLYDAVDTHLIQAEFSMDNGLTWTPWYNPYLLGSVACGKLVKLLIRGILHTKDQCFITNTAVITSITPDPCLENNTATLVVPIDAMADLCIAKFAYPQIASPSQAILYRILVTNLGPDTAENVVVTDTIPPSIGQVRFSLDQGQTWQAWTGQYTLDFLQANEAVTFLMTGTICRYARGTIISQAQLASSAFDPNPENNHSCATICIRQNFAFCNARRSFCPNPRTQNNFR